MGNQSRGKLIDSIVEGRITSVCNRECLNISYMELQNQLIETRKRIAGDLRDDKLRLLEIYDKLNNDISELVFKALYIEGYKDGKS
ncbi:hypothetical protein [Ruminiclostridium papyrosolvens]|uniref:Uncharacterized protein n=1 Tax=Ruminiclostridium papyrosolvens C7 TaxID=1330534 RepID=U4R2H2_9FIRM|nr:hypothetical protein [Ruminiclostridium papyrosolvens]EPR12334.1 hypothetical protein L323_08455 [Ruminiclostridium papyrosolvens C7]